MSVNQETLFTTMLQALILKYGVMLDTKKCAEALSISTRTLDERRKAGEDCPEYIETKRSIMYPAQSIIEYQLKKSKQCVKVL